MNIMADLKTIENAGRTIYLRPDEYNVVSKKVATKAGKSLGKTAAKGLVAVDAVLEARDALNAYNKDPNSYKQEVTKAGMGFLASTGAAIGSTAVAGSIGGPVGFVAGIALGISSLAVDYAIDMTSASANYNIDEIFNPDLSGKRHMTGLASQLFSKKLVDEKTGKVDWLNMDTLNEYGYLLTQRIHQLEDEIKAHDAWIPDGIRAWDAFGIRSESANRALENIADQESRKSDLKIANSAHAELIEQMNAVRYFRQAEGEAALALSRLTRGVSRDITLLDLDRDHDHVLTEADFAEIRKVVNNDKVANFLRRRYAQFNINFDDMTIAQAQSSFDQVVQAQNSTAQSEQAPQMAGSNHNYKIPQTSYTPPTGGLFTWIGGIFTNIFSGIFNMLKSLFTSEPQYATISAPTPQTPPSQIKNSQEQYYTTITPPTTPRENTNILLRL